MEEMKLSAVKVALEAAEQKAIAIGSPSSIAVLASAEISQAKAYTSRSMDAPTSALGELVQPGGPLYGIGNAHLKVGRPLITFGGGVPVIIGGAVVGAVGVAGGSPDQDEEIAQAAADALGGA